jgi:hypothetical protein
MHYLNPQIDHLDRLGLTAEIADVLVQRDLVVLDTGWSRFLGLCLDVVADTLEVGLFGRGELEFKH